MSDKQENPVADIRSIPTGLLVMNVSMASHAVTSNEMQLQMVMMQMAQEKMIVEPPQVTQMKETLVEQKVHRDRMVLELNERFKTLDTERAQSFNLELFESHDSEPIPVH